VTNDYALSYSGGFVLTLIEFDSPANNLCINATQVTGDVGVSGSTLLNATKGLLWDFVKDVWYEMYMHGTGG
jgi:hypothetical protein